MASADIPSGQVYDAWLAIVSRATWRNPEDVKASHPTASILKAGRVVFNIIPPPRKAPTRRSSKRAAA